ASGGFTLRRGSFSRSGRGGGRSERTRWGYRGGGTHHRKARTIQTPHTPHPPYGQTLLPPCARCPSLIYHQTSRVKNNGLPSFRTVSLTKAPQVSRHGTWSPRSDFWPAVPSGRGQLANKRKEHRWA